jgi:hypothetical protein
MMSDVRLVPTMLVRGPTRNRCKRRHIGVTAAGAGVLVPGDQKLLLVLDGFLHAQHGLVSQFGRPFERGDGRVAPGTPKIGLPVRGLGTVTVSAGLPDWPATSVEANAPTTIAVSAQRACLIDLNPPLGPRIVDYTHIDNPRPGRFRHRPSCHTIVGLACPQL